MPPMRSSFDIAMLLASTRTGLCARSALAIDMIMFVDPGPRGDFAGDPRESIGCGAHDVFDAAAKRRDAGCGNRIDHGVVAGAAEQRGQSFGLAGAREHLGAAQALLAELERDWLLVVRFHELVSEPNGRHARCAIGGPRPPPPRPPPPPPPPPPSPP